MENVVGIFKEKRNAVSAIEELRAAGFAPERLVLLTPDHSSDTLQAHLAKMLNNQGWVWLSAVWPVAQPV